MARFQREREQSADLPTITAFRCDSAKIRRRVFDPGNGEWLAHSIMLWPGSGHEGIESNSRTDSQPKGELTFRTVGIIHQVLWIAATADHGLIGNGYPRKRGEHQRTLAITGIGAGSSPRTRGIHIV
jgi:hypothetical protein